MQYLRGDGETDYNLTVLLMQYLRGDGLTFLSAHPVLLSGFTSQDADLSVPNEGAGIGPEYICALVGEEPSFRPHA